MAIQLLYLMMYLAAFLWAGSLVESLSAWLGRPAGHRSVDLASGAVGALALMGMAIRLYLLPLVAVDHAQTGVQFRRLFPLLFVLDEIWALMPLSLSWDLWLRLPCIPPLVFLPFSQRTLVASAYDLHEPRRVSTGSSER